MNNYDMETIGKFIAERRKEVGYTQSQLADLINTSFKTISSWENGHSFPDLIYQKDLCSLLHISLEELHNGKLNKKKRVIDTTLKIFSSVLLFLFILFLPTFIYLINYYNKTYDSFHIYNINGLDNDKLIFDGTFIEYYDYNTFIINNIYDASFDLTKELISFQLYHNGELIYQSNIIDQPIFGVDKIYNVDDKWTFKIMKNNTILYVGKIVFAKNQVELLNNNSYQADRNNEDIIKKELTKKGFTAESNDTYVKQINKNERIYYYFGDQKLYYWYSDNTLLKMVEYYKISNDVHGIVYYTNNKNPSVVEKFINYYNTDEFKCLSLECPNGRDLVKIMNEYVTLI